MTELSLFADTPFNCIVNYKFNNLCLDKLTNVYLDNSERKDQRAGRKWWGKR